MSFISLKKKNLVLLKKKFISKIDLNKCFAKLTPFDGFQPSYNLLMKTHLYNLSKHFKYLRVKGSSYTIDEFSLKLQSSKLYDSFVENERRLLLFRLESKIFNWEIKNLSSISVSTFTTISFGSIDPDVKQGFCAFDKSISTISSDKHNKLLAFFRAKNFFNSLFVNRFSRQVSLKKKYRLSDQALKGTHLKILSLISFYKLGCLKYIKTKYNLKKIFNKLVWRRKKRNKWKHGVLFRFFRSRHRLFYKFYIPKYLEINYKTFGFVHLDSLDVSSLHPKFSFWLNLRRLLTFLSS